MRCASEGRSTGVVEAKKLTLGPQNVLSQAERYSKGIEGGDLRVGAFGVSIQTQKNPTRTMSEGQQYCLQCFDNCHVTIPLCLSDDVAHRSMQSVILFPIRGGPSDKIRELIRLVKLQNKK